jgi:hypothetical protein
MGAISCRAARNGRQSIYTYQFFRFALFNGSKINPPVESDGAHNGSGRPQLLNSGIQNMLPFGFNSEIRRKNTERKSRRSEGDFMRGQTLRQRFCAWLILAMILTFAPSDKTLPLRRRQCHWRSKQLYFQGPGNPHVKGFFLSGPMPTSLRNGYCSSKKSTSIETMTIATVEVMNGVPALEK